MNHFEPRQTSLLKVEPEVIIFVYFHDHAVALVWHIMKFSKIGPGLSVAIDECYIDDDNMVMLKVQTSKTHLFRNCPMYTYLCKHY